MAAANLHRISELSASQLEAWRELELHAAEANPFLGPDFAVPAARALGADDVSLMTAEQDGQWTACLPVRRLRAPYTTHVSWSHDYCFLGTPLIRRDSPLEGALALLAPVSQRHSALMLQQVSSDGPVYDALGRAATELGLERALERNVERAVVRLRPQDAPSAINAKRRRDLRRSRRILEEELGGPISFERAELNQAAIKRFLELEAAGWKGARGTALGSSAAHQEFFSAVAETFAADGRMQLYVLTTEDGRWLAMTCLICDDTVFGFKTAYDEQFHRAAPGVQTVAARIDAFQADQREQIFDSCSDPDNKLLNRLMPDRRPLADFMVTRAGLSGSVAAGAMRSAEKLRALKERVSRR
jgi:CelD/BcsL family acetyltransferase involved in cellulose biosynthesis